MKHALLAAFLVVGGAACGDSASGMKSDASDLEADGASAPDAVVRLDGAPEAQAPAPDLAADAGLDAEPATDTALPADSGADLATPSADASPDLGADAGGAMCGTASREMLCFSYCDGVGRFCSGANMQYRSTEECRAACNGPTWACGKTGDMTGNSLYCRLAHMALAGLGAAAKECPNAGPGSAACQ